MTATLHGQYQQLDGTARTGRLIVAVDVVDQQVRDSDGVVVFSGPLIVELVKGEATVTVPATDDASLVPTGFTYTVTEQLDDLNRDQWRRVTIVATEGQTVELATRSSAGEALLGNYPAPASQADVNALTTALAVEVARAEAAEESTADDLAGHEANHANPHAVTKAQVGLGLVDNTDDLHKPVSADQAAAIAAAADAVTAALSSRITSDEAEVAALTTLVGALRDLSDATLSAAVQTKIDAAISSLGDVPGALEALATLTTELADDESAAAALTTAVSALRTLSDATLVAALDAAYTRRANNLSDLGSAATARGNLGLGTSAVLDVPAAGNAAAGQVVKGNDGRLSDARTPTAHTHPESDVVGLTADLAGKVGTGRQVLGGTGLTGGGDLSADRTLAVDFVASGGSSSTKAVRADDARLSDTRTPTDATVTAAKVAGSLKPSGTAATTDEALRALGTAAGTAAAGNDSRLSDTRTPADGSVTAAKVAGSLKPSGTAATTDEALRALGTAAGTAAPGNDSRITGAAQKASNLSDLASASAARANIGAIAPQIDQYSTAQTATAYTVPSGAKALMVRTLAGGGGGGSGRKGAAGTVRCGGGGGSGGGYSEVLIPVSALAGATTLYVTVGAGGIAGSIQATNSTDGNTGGAGGVSRVATDTNAESAANTLCRATGGNGGSGGTATSGTGGASVSNARFPSSAGTAASTTGGVGSSGGTGNGAGGAGGASGGGITAADSNSSGGASSVGPGWYGTTNAGGTGAGGAGAAGSNPPFGLYPGQSGSGGAASKTATTTAGAGGAGGYGAGGGGGGAALDSTVNSGAGGVGGVGFVEIVAYF